MSKPYKYELVMVIDDSKTNLFIFERIAQMYGFARKVHDHKNLPELIFLDIHMPIMSGFGFLEEYAKLQDSIKRKSIYILSSSAVGNDITRSKENPYVIDFIEKPISPEKLKSL